jgi:hypothetical protein
MAELSGKTALTALDGTERLPILGPASTEEPGGFYSVTPDEMALYTGYRVLGAWTISSVATFEVALAAYWADYAELEVHLLNLIPATDGAQLWCRMSTDGGATFDAGGTDYRYAHTRQISGNSSPQGAQSAGASAISMNEGNGAGNGAAEGISARVFISGGAITTLKPRIRYDCDVYTDNDLLARFMGAGLRNNAQDTTDLQFRFASGNIASGRARLIGIR